MEITELLSKNSELNNYYLSLPDYIKDTIIKNSYNINSAEDLIKYAGLITRNDWWGNEV